MSIYTPGAVPTKAEDVPDFLEVEVEELKRAINVKEFLKLEETNVDPFRPQDGEIRLADGTNWDPIASGRGIYWYDGDAAAWKLLG